MNEITLQEFAEKVRLSHLGEVRRVCFEGGSNLQEAEIVVFLGPIEVNIPTMTIRVNRDSVLDISSEDCNLDDQTFYDDTKYLVALISPLNRHLHEMQEVVDRIVKANMEWIVDMLQAEDNFSRTVSVDIYYEVDGHEGSIQSTINNKFGTGVTVWKSFLFADDEFEWDKAFSVENFPYRITISYMK